MRPQSRAVRIYQQRLRSKFGYHEVPVFSHEEFGRMLLEMQPDVVVVCTIDREHDRYIVEALRAGCDVITEKPMTISAEKCTAIFEAVKASGRSLRVAFNYRWGPGATRVREVLNAAPSGHPTVTMEYLRNTSHGRTIFGGGTPSGTILVVLVHKSTHHLTSSTGIVAIPARCCPRHTGVLRAHNALRRATTKSLTHNDRTWVTKQG